MCSHCVVSVVIPSRNEPYLKNTIEDLLKNSDSHVEIIAVLDGYWPKPEEIIDDPRVIYLHNETAKGMRAGINDAVALAKGKFILKSDAHCMFGPKWDKVLKEHCKENWVVVPRRYALDPIGWQIEENPKYPIDYMYLSKDLHGMPWTDRNRDKRLESRVVDDLMSAQGSCWFMHKSYYQELELLDEESYGTFFSEFQEIGLKCWLSEGRVVVNKQTWYAHWHKPKDVGRGYSLSRGEQEKADAQVQKWVEGKGWHKQIHPLSWLIEKFSPVPTW